MKLIKFACPKCSRNVRVKAESVESLMSETFVCPACKGSTPFREILQDGPKNDLKTHIVGANSGVTGGSTDKTMISHVAPVAILVVKTGQIIPVPDGIHVLGRLSSDSTATIKLTPDPYMSRSHARLGIDSRPGGFGCVIEPLKSANPVIINGQPLKVGQKTRLSPNDSIVMGMTELKLIKNS